MEGQLEVVETVVVGELKEAVVVLLLFENVEVDKVEDTVVAVLAVLNVEIGLGVVVDKLSVVVLPELAESVIVVSVVVYDATDEVDPAEDVVGV